MYIKDTMFESFGNFELDSSAISLHSLNRTNIELPYSGSLPEEHISSASAAWIYFNVQLVQGARIVLVIESDGECSRYSLGASVEEIISFLDAFFGQANKDTGLNPYSLGLWQAHYMEWRAIARTPYRLTEIVTALNPNGRKSITAALNLL